MDANNNTSNKRTNVAVTDESPPKHRRVERPTRITDVKLHCRLHIYNFLGHDVSLPRYDINDYEDVLYSRMTFGATVFGDLEAIQYLAEEIDENPLTPQRFKEDKSYCKILTDVTYILGRTQHWKALQWVIDNDYPMDKYTFGAAIHGGANINLLRWLHSKNCELGVYTFIYAAERGDLEIMKWLRSIECPWDEVTFCQAVVHDDLEILKWLKIEECPWNASVFATAALLKCQLETLLWLLVEECPWDSATFTNAVKAGRDFLTLRWLYLQKCPWGKKTFVSAVRRGDMEILKWLHEKKCPWNAECYEAALEEKNGDVLEWLHKEGCPRSEATVDLYVKNLVNVLKNT